MFKSRTYEIHASMYVLKLIKSKQTETTIVIVCHHLFSTHQKKHFFNIIYCLFRIERSKKYYTYIHVIKYTWIPVPSTHILDAAKLNIYFCIMIMYRSLFLYFGDVANFFLIS